jgi:hypothetical protein
MTSAFRRFTGMQEGSTALQNLRTGQDAQTGTPARQTSEPRSINAAVCAAPLCAGNIARAALSIAFRDLALSTGSVKFISLAMTR